LKKIKKIEKRPSRQEIIELTPNMSALDNLTFEMDLDMGL
jgi:hypothetical protein